MTSEGKPSQGHSATKGAQTRSRETRSASSLFPVRPPQIGRIRGLGCWPWTRCSGALASRQRAALSSCPLELCGTPPELQQFQRLPNVPWSC